MATPFSLWRSGMRQMVDHSLKPQLLNFGLRSALRMKQEDILEGATHAAQMVSEARGDALLQCDSAALDALVGTESLGTHLHARLAATATAARGDGADAALLELGDAALHLAAAPSLESVRVIVGAHRAGFEPEAFHRLEVGSSLVVLSEDPYRLWQQSTMQDLMGEHGCTVQCVVKFDAGTEAAGTEFLAPPQTYIFEVPITSERLDRPPLPWTGKTSKALIWVNAKLDRNMEHRIEALEEDFSKTRDKWEHGKLSDADFEEAERQVMELRKIVKMNKAALSHDDDEDEEDDEDDEDDGVEFSLVDLNGVCGDGDPFWSAASPAPWL